MCLIAWNWQPQSAQPLLLIANRDEYFARPALPLHWWENATVLAGKDLQAGGTWLGVSRSGRLAALTNYRAAVRDAEVRPSRGALVADFLQGSLDAKGYLQAVARKAADYNPFNLLVFDGKQLLGLESRHARIVPIQPGVSAVSNADFDTPWPKLVDLKQGLARHLQQRHLAVPELLPLLQDATLATDAELPDTGVPLEWERRLSAIKVLSPEYGTRASSIVTLGRTGLQFFEQSYDAQGPTQAAEFHFTVQGNKETFEGGKLISLKLHQE